MTQEDRRGRSRRMDAGAGSRVPFVNMRPPAHVFILLRCVVALGAGVWTVWGAAPLGARLQVLAAVAAFLAYSLLALQLIRRWPQKAGAFHLSTTAADFAALYVVFSETGGLLSPFLPAVFPWCALTALNYGPYIGIAAVFGLLALAVAGNPAALVAANWSALLLLFLFAGLTGGYVGWLARREAKERQDIEALDASLQARAADLEAANRRCLDIQDHLVHSERLATIGRMSAEMAHQVRNPLGSISLNLELLEDEINHVHGPAGNPAARRGPDSRGQSLDLPAPAEGAACGGRGEACVGYGHAPDSQLEEILGAIHKEIGNLVELTESYLRFANLPPFKLERTDLGELVRSIVAFSKPNIQKRAIKLSQRLASELPPVQVDRRQLKFALLGIISNALEAMESGGRLQLRTQLNGQGGELSISDTGSGIPQAEQAQIFEPFFTTKQGGTGLGLPLARRIIEAHGGHIRCRSLHGVGTTFTILLPTAGRSGQLQGARPDPRLGPAETRGGGSVRRGDEPGDRRNEIAADEQAGRTA